MGRHNLVLRRVNSYQAIPSDELQPVIDTFSQDVRDFIGLHDMDLSQIYNMDQTAIFFDMPPTYTVVQKGSKRNKILVNPNNAKKRVTVILLARGDGQKLKPLIVFKTIPDARVAREVEKYNNKRTHHTVQENAWTDTQVQRSRGFLQVPASFFAWKIYLNSWKKRHSMRKKFP